MNKAFSLKVMCDNSHERYKRKRNFISFKNCIKTKPAESAPTFTLSHQQEYYVSDFANIFLMIFQWYFQGQVSYDFGE